MNLSDNNSDHSFWREVMRAYGFPIIMFTLAIIPGLNFTYSGHGGISWFVVPLCFPYVILRALIKITKGSEGFRRVVQELLQDHHSVLHSPRASTFLGRHNLYSNDFWSAHFHLDIFCPDGLALSMVVLHMISKHFGYPFAPMHRTEFFRTLLG